MIDKNRSRELTVISLGAGVQSTTMALMSAVGELPPVDCSIFADTKNESEAVYSYLENLKKKLPFPIHHLSKSNIYDDFINNVENNVRSPNPPLFTQKECY